VLSAGERRAYTANDIYRDASWRKRDFEGARRVSREDAEALDLIDGGLARAETPAAGHTVLRQSRYCFDVLLGSLCRGRS
jgi:hypothetical protein